MNDVIGSVCSPAATTSIDIAVRKKAHDRIMEGDFIYTLDKGHKVIGRVVRISAEGDDTENIDVFANAEIYGFIDDSGAFSLKRFPVMPGSKIRKFSPEDVTRLFRLEKGIYVGKLSDTDAKVHIDIDKLLRGHTFIPAKTGAGKSWLLGVMLEGFSKHDLPVLVIDPHGEYHSLSEPWLEKKDEIKEWGLKPRGFKVEVIEVNPNEETLHVGDKYIHAEFQEEKGETTGEATLVQLQFVPSNVSYSIKTQAIYSRPSFLYGYIKMFMNVNKRKPFISLSSRQYTFKGLKRSPDIIWEPEQERYKLFASIVELGEEELVHKGVITIIDLSKVDPDMTRFAVGLMLNELFLKRKRGEVGPFVLIVEETHKFSHANEKYFSSATIDTLSKEARKYGMPCMFVSQRSSLVSTTVRANCENWIVLKTTHPGDQNAIIGSCEGLDAESRELIKNLPIGVAFFTGSIVDFPIIVQVRHRQSRHSYSTGFMDMLKTDGDD